MTRGEIVALSCDVPIIGQRMGTIVRFAGEAVALLDGVHTAVKVKSRRFWIGIYPSDVSIVPREQQKNKDSAKKWYYPVCFGLLCVLVLAILQRCHPGGAPKHLAEVAAGVKTGVHSDLGDGAVGVEQQRLRMAQPVLLQKGDGGDIHLGLEQPVALPVAHIDYRREVGYLQIFGVMLLDIQQDGL